ncbi:Protein of unknown function [Gryllus bimaculatus]|nr:Protein of unknown function [Gryllus bimaculatus]
MLERGRRRRAGAVGHGRLRRRWQKPPTSATPKKKSSHKKTTLVFTTNGSLLRTLPLQETSRGAHSRFPDSTKETDSTIASEQKSATFQKQKNDFVFPTIFDVKPFLLSWNFLIIK